MVEEQREWEVFERELKTKRIKRKDGRKKWKCERERSKICKKRVRKIKKEGMEREEKVEERRQREGRERRKRKRRAKRSMWYWEKGY